MTTNKPEVVAWYTPTTRDTLPVVALNDRSQRGEPLIRLSDYEALQAECEHLRQERDGLRADAVRYRWLRKQHEKHLGLTICKVGMFDLTPWSGDDPDAAIDNAMAKEQGDAKSDR